MNFISLVGILGTLVYVRRLLNIEFKSNSFLNLNIYVPESDSLKYCEKFIIFREIELSKIINRKFADNCF